MPIFVRYINTNATTARAAEFPASNPNNVAAYWTNTGPNQCTVSSIGIGSSTNLPTGTNTNWTLNDQFNVPRTPQSTQPIGGLGYSTAGTSSGQEGWAANSQFFVCVTNPNNVVVNGISIPDPAVPPPALTPATNYSATLSSLAVGWVPA